MNRLVTFNRPVLGSQEELICSTLQTNDKSLRTVVTTKKAWITKSSHIPPFTNFIEASIVLY